MNINHVLVPCFIIDSSKLPRPANYAIITHIPVSATPLPYLPSLRRHATMHSRTSHVSIPRAFSFPGPALARLISKFQLLLRSLMPCLGVTGQRGKSGSNIETSPAQRATIDPLEPGTRKRSDA